MSENEKIITKEMLNDLGVYELRELARSIGVLSPTTKKREHLCKEIFEISSGAVKVQSKASSKGRPPKSITKISNIVSEYIPEEILRLQKTVCKPEFTSIVKLAQNPSRNDVVTGKYKEIYGFVNSVQGHYYLKNLGNNELFSGLNFYIPENFVEQFSLRNGDKIVAKGRMSETYYCGLVEEVVKINGVCASNWKLPRNNLDLTCLSIPSVKTQIFGKEIKKGGRTISSFQNMDEAILAVAQEVEKLKNSNEKLVFLGIEVSPEIMFYGQVNRQLEMFATTYSNTLDESFDAILNAVNHCNTLLKDGFDVRLFVFDVVGILTRLDQYFASENKDYMGHNVSAVQLVKKLVGAGKSFSTNVSITSHSIVFDADKNCEIVEKEFSKIAKII